MATVVYSLKQFEDISWQQPLEIGDDIISLINELTEQVGSPSYNKTPNFNSTQSSEKKFNKKPKKYTEIAPDDWVTVRNFKKTEIAVKEGIDKQIDEIRSLLNKVTEKTFDAILVKMIDKLDSNVEELKQNEEGLSKIGTSIFNIATSNTFNSEVFSKLIKTLIEKYEFMEDIFNQAFDQFIQIFSNIQYCSPDDDYDKFCQMNIDNDKRRAMSLFVINLTKLEIIPKNKTIGIINQLQSMITAYIHEESQENVIEELAENLYILVVQGFYHLKDCDEWQSIYDNIETISKMKHKQYPSISRKAVFKHMDIIDKIKN
jgi:hypothetical protein